MIKINVAVHRKPEEPPDSFILYLSRVPGVDEILRMLVMEHGLTKARLLRVTRVMHTCHDDEYPRREGSLDAWVDCVPADPRQ